MIQGFSRPIMMTNLNDLCKETKCDHKSILHLRNVAIVKKWARASFQRFGYGPMPPHLR